MSAIVEHRSRLFAFVFSIVRDFHKAEDVLQDTCLTICAKAELFEPGTDFLAWARSIAAREIKGLWKNRRYTDRSIPVESIDTVAEVWDEPASADAGGAQDRRQALYECVRALPPRSLSAVASFYERGRSCSEIAEEQRSTATAVRMLLKRARDKLMDCVRRKLGPTAEEYA
jgi:RNA polymerase sigma-70 factor (ECF subfamily)